MHTYNFYCTINKPTRVCDTTATLIDHIWVSNIENAHSSYIIVDDQTDHYAVECHFTSRHPMPSQVIYTYKRIFKETSKNAFRQELSGTSWEEILTLLNPNEAYNRFLNIFQGLYDKHFPQQKVRVKCNSRDDAYLTPALKESLREKRRLHRLAKKYPITYYDQYIRYRDTCNNLVKTARNNYYQEKLIATAGDTRSLWRELNKVMGRNNRTVDPTIDLPAGSTMNHSDYINHYFNDTIKSLKLNQRTPGEDDFKRFLNPATDFSLRLHPVTEDEVFKYINENKSNAAGYDGLYPRIIKYTADITKKPLAYMINQSFKTGIFPEELKVAKIIPLHKKGKKTDVANKRPISILNVFGKIFEKAIHKRLSTYLEEFELLTPLQHGFRKNHSTESALLSFIQKMYDTINERKRAIALFIDFSKAFDCLDHRILICKLERLGIRGAALELIKSYLSSRKQYVYYNQKYSAPITPEFGTPQGSLLGPLIFLIYVNDIINSATSIFLALYADDANGIKSDFCFETLVREINAELVHINDWIICNGLSINTIKICHMLINCNIDNVQYEIKIGETVIPRVMSTKLLGLHVDEKLKWNIHVNYVADKISKVCGVIYNIRKKLTPQAMRTIYMSLIYSHLIYCIPIWGNTWACHLRPVEVAQKRAVRTISNVARYEHTHELFMNLKLLKLKNVHKYFSSLLIFKFLNCHYVPLIFSRHQNPYALRNANNVYVPHSRSELFLRSVFYNTPSLWYSLDAQLKQIRNIETFKRKLKQYLLAHQN